MPQQCKGYGVRYLQFCLRTSFLYYNHMEQALECDVAGHVTHVFIQMYRSIDEKR